ncbi:receptor-like protein 3 [Triticum dicoccoides]|uniref:receptor-like protein 3 n=1 Tax=Triticum dicoccoides TaxID=85692 RepID=UPI001891329A|nr:receptor-like protein 3 [Triticum dicoccoides]
MPSFTVPPVVLFVVLHILASPATACTEQEKHNLLRFLAGLSRDGGLATSWRDNSTNCCKWEGVVCNEDEAVTEVSLGSKGLEGCISPSLANLTSLLHVNLSYNPFSGGLLPELMSSGSIIILDVSFNQLNGPLPDLPYLVTTNRPLQVLNISSNQFSSKFPSATWKVMKNLIALNASNNSFTGNIPSSLCLGSPYLVLLDLCYNQLSGNIPTALGDCSKLKVLKVGHNNLSGTLPVEIFHAASLEYLSFPNNGLQGELDGAHIVRRSNIRTLDLGGNHISGKIPESIGQLTRLEELHLGNNNMSGELPSTLSNCKNLKTIDLKLNDFSGDLGKVNFATLQNLKSLDLIKNNLNGIVPESIYSCSNLTALRLSGNHFHGEISLRIGNLKHLSFLSLVRNSFTNITKTLHALESCRNISILLIGRNFMNEAMPQDEIIDGFQNLQFLSMCQCSLTGRIPAWLSKLTSLKIACTEQEKRNLLQFLAGLSRDGGIATSWHNSGTDCCEWEGISCNGDGAVTGVSLESKGLEGPISPFLANLTSLLRVNLSHNSFSGGLPAELVFSGSIIVLDVSFSRLNGPLPEFPSLVTTNRPLQVLNISSNQFSSQFPSATWKVMNSLIALNASNNSFTGNIPPSLCLGSPYLALLDLCYNQLSGDIPNTLGNCSKLKVLKAGNNNLSGILPVDTFCATSLEYLSFPNNGLQGELDGAHIVKLSNLATLDLEGNHFSGKIPQSIGLLKRLEELHFGSNDMSGELPSTLGNCTNLKIIDLKFNNFSGDLGKVNFAALQNLKSLDLLRNNLSGIIPESIYSCSNLTALRLSENHFRGEISSRIGNLKHLSFLSISRNSFTNITKVLHALKSCRNISALVIGTNFMNEAMPQDETIDGFQNLQLLTMDWCSLTGRVPIWLSKLTNLKILQLQSNRLTGTMPSWINSLNYLFSLDVSNNSLTGTIPITLMEMPMLKSDNAAIYLDPNLVDLPIFYVYPSFQYRMGSDWPKVLKLGKNKLTGTIPQEIGHLKALLCLDLSFNNFYGEIPQSVCNLTNLQILDLSNNHLTGEIPAAFETLHFLSEFNMSNNDLGGPIPTTGQLSTFPTSSFDGNPKLCGSLLIRDCSSAEEAPMYIISAREYSMKVIFAISFGLFFGVGVLYDQLILFRYFG